MMDFENEKNITIFTHPLIQHKISILRDKKTGTNEFRKLVEEIAMLEGFEALSDLPTEDVEIETPIETCMTPMISAIGVRNVVENKVDLTKSRNLIIAGVIFVCGLGFGGGLTFTIGGTSITLTALAIAAIAGILLNAILPGNDYEFGKNPAGDSSRGVYVMNTDSEKEESEDNK